MFGGKGKFAQGGLKSGHGGGIGGGLLQGFCPKHGLLHFGQFRLLKPLSKNAGSNSLYRLWLSKNSGLKL